MKTTVRTVAAVLALGFVGRALSQPVLIHDVDISPLKVTIGPIANCLAQPTTDPVSLVRTRTFKLDEEQAGRDLRAVFASLPALSDPPAPATLSRFGIADHPANPNPPGDLPNPPYFHMPVLRAGYSYVRLQASEELAEASSQIEQAAAALQSLEQTQLQAETTREIRLLRERLASLREQEILLGSLPFSAMIPPEKKPGSDSATRKPVDAQPTPPAQAPAVVRPPIWYPFFVTRLAAGNAAGTDVLTLAYEHGGAEYVVIVNTNANVTMKVYWRSYPAQPQAYVLDLQPAYFVQFKSLGGQITQSAAGALPQKPDLSCLAQRAHAAFEAAVAHAGAEN